MRNKWRLVGLDTFSYEWYPILNDNYSKRLEFETEDEARLAAEKQLEKIEQQQPTASSGGQDPGGIQDRIYIESPTGERYRYTKQ